MLALTTRLNRRGTRSGQALHWIAVLFLIGATSVAAQPADLYVKTPANGGNNANNGLSWATAKATIGAAMASAFGGDSVFVAAGTYNESVLFPQANSIQLLGGYPAAGGGRQRSTGQSDHH